MTGFRRTRLVLQLAFSHHEWLPSPNSGGGTFASLEDMLSKAGIGRVALLRHGNAAPARNGVDFERLLTDLGKNQAREAGSSFGAELRPFFSRLMVSTAPRTVETAELLLKESGEENAEIETIPILYDGTMQPMGSRLFRKIGYAPLEKYLNNENVEDRLSAQTVLGEYAYSVMSALNESVAASSSCNQLEARGQTKTLWVVGHAIYLPAVALQLSTILNCDDAAQKLILGTNTKEAEGYLINLSPPAVRLLVRCS